MKISIKSSLLFIVISLHLSNSILTGQSFPRVDIPFYENGELLKNPLGGGLNAPQFWKVDLNNDGVKDLYVFDRIGGVHLTFLNTGGMGEDVYVFAPELAVGFPEMYNFVVPVDYDNDGVVDIFTHHGPGINGMVVYKGAYESGHLVFERVHFYGWNFDVLTYPYGTSGRTQIYVANTDVPVVEDIDGDGDMDILSFEVGGTIMYYYKNVSVESGYGADSLLYILEDNCWGRFNEGLTSEDIIFSDDVNVCGAGLENTSLSPRHSGSTFCVFDFEGDEDWDLILGDISNDKLYFLKNEKTAGQAFFVEEGSDFSFPGYDVPVNINLFPAPYLLDVDNDGIKDFIAASNDVYDTPDKAVAWYYKNTGTDVIPHFEYQEDNFLVGEMVDVGTWARPVFIDYNMDGLLDLVIGSGDKYVGTQHLGGRLYLYLNTGTASHPEFTLTDDDFLNFSTQGDVSFLSPSFGDMDNDGDLDAIIGEHLGGLYYAENTAGAGNPMQFADPVAGYFAIDVGLDATPFVVDINEDGLNDLVIGERNGNINYLPNSGSPGAPEFHANVEEAPNISFFGHIDMRVAGSASGESCPVVLKFENRTILYSGCKNGHLEAYEIDNNNLNGAFPMLEERIGQIDEGRGSTPAMADINADGILEMLVGNRRGGIAGFNTGIGTDSLVSNVVNLMESPFKVFPNPAHSSLYILSEIPVTADSEILIFNLMGQPVFRGDGATFLQGIDVSHWARGVYLVRIETEYGVFCEKILME